ncbi:MAG: hypothetical protein LBO66_08935 [Deltaproteobacteria bacterium]|jgi:hypothetical protein|nr:hypothetical protein [Deltaproteobacteria bacterium]
MNPILLAALQTTGAFWLFFWALSFSSTFWGRLLLRALKVPYEARDLGGVLPLVAFAGTLAGLGRYLKFFFPALDAFYFFLFVGGLAGFAAETLLRAKGDIAREKKPLAALAGFCRRERALLPSALLALPLSLYFCLIWPTGTFESWLSPNLDYYSWIFWADYWRGFVNPANYGVTNVARWSLDGFGTQIFMGFWAAASREITLTAVTGILITLLAYAGGAAYVAIRLSFNVGRLWSYALALGLVGSAFFNFLAFYGYFAQLAAIWGFLATVTAFLAARETDGLKDRAAALFFPLLFLLTFYQAGFAVFAALSLSISFFYERASLAGAGAGFRPSLKIAARRALVPFGLAALALALAFPQTVWGFAVRSVGAYRQIGGYGLGLIDPAFFVAAPLLDYNLLTRASSGGGAYALYALALAALFLLGTRGGNPYWAREGRARAQSLALALALALGVYLVAYFARGDDYQVWKFASFAVLPLSFVGLALLLACLFRLARGRRVLYHFLAALALAVLLLVPALTLSSPFYQSQWRNRNRSLSPMIYGVSAALRAAPPAREIIFDLSQTQRSLAVAILAESLDARLYFINAKYYLRYATEYIPLLGDDTLVFSDREYPGLFNGARLAPSAVFTLHRWDASDFARQGAVSFYPMDPQYRSPFASPLKVVFREPEATRGEDLAARFKIEFASPRPGESADIVPFLPDGTPLAFSWDAGGLTVETPRSLRKDPIWEIWLALPPPYGPARASASSGAEEESEGSDPSVGFGPFRILDATLELLP